MILIDANLLIYAVKRDSPVHRESREWLEQVLRGAEPVGFAWVVLLAFLRLTTRRRLFEHPLSIKAALDIVDSWLEQPASTTVHPGRDHARILRKLLLTSGAGGNTTTDAHLAALAIEQDAELYSDDRDFRQFAGLRWRNPLQ
jgi:toxin-antitoxin system PIN domain toxin